MARQLPIINRFYYANTKSDAAWIGFDDSFFYEELAKKPDERVVKEIQINHNTAHKVFKERKEKVKDIKY